MGRQAATGQASNAQRQTSKATPTACRFNPSGRSPGSRGKPAPPMPRLPMRLHSGVLRHLTSPTVAGAAPALQLAKAIYAPDSRLNHRNRGSHLRGAHGSRIGQGHRRALATGQAPRVGTLQIQPRVGGVLEFPRAWKQHAEAAARAHQGAGEAGAQPVHWCPTVTGASNHALPACSRFPGHGSDVPRRQRGRGLAESGTRMCRGGESDRMSDRAEEPVPGRAAAPTEARERQRAWRCPENPYLTPTPASAPRPALAARALQGTRAHGAPAVPPRPDGSGASRLRLARSFAHSRSGNGYQPHAPCSACSRSASRSSMCSIPIDSRTVSSLTPACSSSAGPS
ncbi:hypothetical protein CPBF424_24840 [Xanthomonas euroxanthea]|uniref:Uncharacterized protein n=1 Tax=Xanthomonas euroxanthea TaxID=2259622 RepID=A0AA46HAV3_9XANT|nr:hypothetical protein CPBF424_24840 [Xanthomonas euroxanthea]